jgi:type III secretion system YscQ/HrcQ family protein
MAVHAFPWAALERVSKRTVRELRAARERLSGRFDAGRASAELSQLLGAELRADVESLAVGAPAQRLIEVTLRAGGARVTLGAESALVFALLERVLGRPFTLKQTKGPLDPALHGAFAALVLEAARRVASAPPLLEAHGIDDEDALNVRARITFEGRAYTAYALVGGERGLSPSDERGALERLGPTQLSVPLVVGLSLVSRTELAKLQPGWAFVPGDGLFIDGSGRGFGALAAAGSERGVRVELGAASGIVLRDETLALAPDFELSGVLMDEPNDAKQTLTEAALEAPVVVRIELGAVSMSAADWAKLRPGDVIDSGRRVGEPVVLRIGGRVVARGELVDVEGDLGVRVRELSSAAEP